MLVLSRKVGGRVIIRVGDEVIEVLVTNIDRNKVRLGVKAHPSVTIHREEVDKVIQEAKA